MRRFTILSLMTVVCALAVGLAALRGANDYWAGGLLMATPLIFGLGLLGALCGDARRRAGRLGFLVLGGGYFALAFLGLSESNLNRLPTSMLLRAVHERVAPSQTISLIFTTTTAPTTPTPTTLTLSSVNGGSTLSSGASPFAVSLQTPDPPVNRWRTYLPGAANLEAFSAVGHCLFALLFGLVGALVALRFEKRRDQVTPAG